MLSSAALTNKHHTSTGRKTILPIPCLTNTWQQMEHTGEQRLQLLSHVPAQGVAAIAPPPTPATDVRPLLSSSHPPPSLLPSLSLSYCRTRAVCRPTTASTLAISGAVCGTRRGNCSPQVAVVVVVGGVGSGGVARSAGVIRSLRNLRRSHLTTIVLTTHRLDSNTSTP